MYEFRVLEVVRVVDGDTVDLRIDMGFHLQAIFRFRLLGVNTPEIFGQHKAEDGLLAKDATIRWFMKHDKDLVVKTYKTDSFGRWLAYVTAPNACLNEELRKSGWIDKDHKYEPLP